MITRIVATVAFVFMLIFLCEAGSAVKGNVMRLRVDVSANCAFFFTSSSHIGGAGGYYTWTKPTPDGEEHPEWGGRWIVSNIDQPKGKALLAILLAAKSQGALVNIIGMNTNVLWSEEVQSVEISE